MEPISVSRDTLNGIMEFDRVILVSEDGAVKHVSAKTRESWAPEVTISSESDTESIHRPYVSGDGWRLLGGYSGQYSYSGPIMHPSEYVGGKLADHILSTPGYWCVVEVTDMDSPDDPCGWAVAFKEPSA